MGDPLRAPKVIRLNDLHQPDILPVIRLPVPPPPPRGLHDEAKTESLVDKTTTATLDAVIKLLNQAGAETAKLVPLEEPRLRPEDTTPLIDAIEARNPSVFNVKKTETSHKKKQRERAGGSGTKRPAPLPVPDAMPAAAGADTPLQVAPAAAQPPAALTGTPASGGAPRNKRARTSLKLNLSGSEKATLAPTLLEEAAGVADSLQKIMTAFCEAHKDLAQDVEGKTMQHDAEEDVDEPQDERPSQKSVAASSQQLLDDIRSLNDALFRACNHQGLLQHVPRGDLVSLLRLMRYAVDHGRQVLLEEEDTEATGHVTTALVALEASVGILRISTAPCEGGQVSSEEALEAVIECSRFQLQHNILPFHDARLRAAVRPELGGSPDKEAHAAGEEEEGEEPPAAATSSPSKTPGKGRGRGGGRGGARGRGKGRSGGKSFAAMGPSIPAALPAIVDRVQAVLSLLCDLLPNVKLPTAMLFPLLRTAISVLTITPLPELQAKATAVIAAAFRALPDHRRSIMDDLMSHAASYMGGTRTLRREYPLSDAAGDEGGNVTMLCAVILQMVQGCVQLPPADADPRTVVQAYGHAVKSADYFWAKCLDRLPAARAHKVETDLDFAAVCAGLVQDLLTAVLLPQWPAASTLLLRLAAALNSQKGLQHQDPAVRQMCLDLLGKMLAHLHGAEVALKGDADWLADVAATNEFDDVATAAPQLLLTYLADRQRSGTSSAAAARRFWLVRLLCEEAAGVLPRDSQSEVPHEAEEQVRGMVLAARKKAEQLEVLTYDTGLDPKDACRLMRTAVHTDFDRAAPAMLSWLLEMMDPRGQAPGTRSKAVKALADVVAVNKEVLNLATVQASVDRSLHDDSISVREAALGLLGRHMAADPELTLRLLDTVITAVEDPGSSVRRCAIKIIKDCAIAVEGFPRAVDACCALIARANDPEETVQNAVAKVFHSLWFSSTLETEAGVVSRTPAQRAQQLADVALACYDAGGSAIHLPLDSQHSLVGVLRAALGWGARGDLHTEWASGQVISEALLEAILALQQRGQGVLGIEGDTTMDSSDADAEDGDAMTAALLALHALAVTDAALCVPEADPLRFLRALAPYLKTGGPSDGEQPSTERGQRRAAERMLCMLCIMDCVLSQVARLDDAMGALTDLPADLVTLINQHRFTQVVAAACKCLAALAEHNKQAASRLAQVAAVYFSWLKAPKTQNPGNLPRFLFIMGQLSRYGSSIIAAATPAITPAACLELFTQYWHYNGPPGLSGQVRRCALEALGQLAIAQPTALVASGSHAKQMLKEALGADAPPAYKMAALGSLTELLQADAESLQRRQKQQDEEAAAITAGAAKKAKGKKGKKGAPTEGSGAAVPTENGEGDALSQSSAILQQHWEAVLVLATDGGRTPGSNGPNPPGNGRMNESGVAVRRRVLSLMEVVLRDGLVGPWTAVPALVALCTDTALDLRTKALRLLCQLAEKHPQYVDAGRLGAGIEASFALHVPQEKAALPLRRGEPAVPAAAEHGIAAVYSRVVAANRSRRNDFLRAVLRPFRSALGSSSSEAGGQQTPRRLLAFAAGVAASLPLRQAEEGCILIQEAGSLVSAHTNRVLVELGAHLEADEDEPKSKVALGTLCDAAIVLCILHRLKAHLERKWGITPDRAAAFAAAGKRKASEDVPTLALDPGVGALDLSAGRGGADVQGAELLARAKELLAELEALHGAEVGDAQD